jgi:hypothetical protein
MPRARERRPCVTRIAGSRSLALERIYVREVLRSPSRSLVAQQILARDEQASDAIVRRAVTTRLAFSVDASIQMSKSLVARGRP